MTDEALWAELERLGVNIQLFKKMNLTTEQLNGLLNGLRELQSRHPKAYWHSPEYDGSSYVGYSSSPEPEIEQEFDADEMEEEE